MFLEIITCYDEIELKTKYRKVFEQSFLIINLPSIYFAVCDILWVTGVGGGRYVSFGLQQICGDLPVPV